MELQAAMWQNQSYKAAPAAAHVQGQYAEWLLDLQAYLLNAKQQEADNHAHRKAPPRQLLQQQQQQQQLSQSVTSTSNHSAAHVQQAPGVAADDNPAVESQQLASGITELRSTAQVCQAHDIT
jgi:hypothetical protein